MIEAEISHLMARTSATVDDEDDDSDPPNSVANAPTAAAIAALGQTPAPATMASSSASGSSWIEVPGKAEASVEQSKATDEATSSGKAVSTPTSEAAVTDGATNEQMPPLGEEEVATELMKMGFEPGDVNLVIEKNVAVQPPTQLLEECTRTLVRLSEWEPLLSDLEEMGFSDRELNKKLMVKNDGSVKRTVKDLVTDNEM